MLEQSPFVDYIEKDKIVKAFAQTLPSGVNRVDGDLSSTKSGNGGCPRPRLSGGHLRAPLFESGVTRDRRRYRAPVADSRFHIRNITYVLSKHRTASTLSFRDGAPGSWLGRVALTTTRSSFAFRPLGPDGCPPSSSEDHAAPSPSEVGRLPSC